jgi:hypothetical protein
MKLKHAHFTVAIITVFVAICSCSKDKNSSDASQYYGKWKSNAGDTITFLQRNGQNICDAGIRNPGPDFHEIEFSFSNNKLSFKDGAADPGKFRILKSFKWIQRGKSFQVQDTDIYSFMSSTSTYFTFEKLP